MKKLFKNTLGMAVIFLFINAGWTSDLKDSEELSGRQGERNSTLKIVNTDARDQLLELLRAAQSFRNNWSNRFQNKLDIFQGNAVFETGSRGETVVSFYSYVENNDPKTKEKQPYKMRLFLDREEWSFTQLAYDLIKDADYGHGTNFSEKINSVSQSTQTANLLFTMKSLFIQMFSLE